MWCDAVLGNLYDPPHADRWKHKRIDLVDVRWRQLNERALGLVSRAGRSLRVMLALGVGLRHGDVLMESDDEVASIHLLPTEVLVLRPRDAAEMGLLALEIGNLHAPAQIVGHELWVIPDGPVEAVLWKMETAYETALRRFAPLACTTSLVPALGSSFTVTTAAAKPKQ